MALVLEGVMKFPRPRFLHLAAGAAALGLPFGLTLLAPTTVFADKSFVVVPNDPACHSLVPAATGGPMPPEGILAIRWLGTTNFELSYDGQVILLDAYYDRGPRNRSIGLGPKDVKRADAIFVGHAHFDHMADAASVGMQTGAPVIGAPTVTGTVISQGASCQSGDDRARR
jgi:glyoxylase-like metal-dependent hydrolase (beta-lactamase superfamily II)